jgi:hypothetical protein
VAPAVIMIHVLRTMPVLLDDILADSFPASDPPSWTLGYVSSALASEDAGDPDADDPRPEVRRSAPAVRVAGDE